MTSAPSTTDVRSTIAVALDVPDLDRAVQVARAVSAHVGVAKVGLELFSSAGPGAVTALRDLGMDVFVDLKLHDIPNTVAGAARSLGSLGVGYLTVHASGGTPMIRAAIEAAREGAERAGHPAPTVLAVTVLTSQSDAPRSLLVERLDAALAAGGTGVVCAAPDLATIKGHAPGILAVTPGIRLPGGDGHDQQRIATPDAAIAGGADLLVVGRAITGAADTPGMTAAAAEIAGRVGAALTARR